MVNVFQNLLKKELGKKKYEDYFSQYRHMEQLCRSHGEKINSTKICNDMYETLRKTEWNILKEKQKRLRDNMMLVFQISRNYVFVFIAYLLGAVVIMGYGEVPSVNIICMSVLSCSFLYKTYEFIVNKYAYLDAYIIIAYKSTLEKVLREMEQIKEGTK